MNLGNEVTKAAQAAIKDNLNFISKAAAMRKWVEPWLESEIADRLGHGNFLS